MVLMLRCRESDDVNKNLLILGGGQYGTVAKEIAEAMGCFDKIDFLDDTYGLNEPKGNYHEKSIGKLADYEKFVVDYSYAIVAIGASEMRKEYTEKLIEVCYRVPILVSPLAYVSKSAQLRHGDIIEPYAVVHANAVVGISTYISAGTVVNHNSFVSDYCHINCNSVVMSGAIVPVNTITQPCEVIRTEKNDVPKEKLPTTPVGEYNFDDVM